MHRGAKTAEKYIEIVFTNPPGNGNGWSYSTSVYISHPSLSLSFTTPCTGTCTFAQNRALHTHTDIYTHTALSRGRTKFLKSGFRTMILAFKSELSRPRLAAPLVRIYTTMRGRSLARTQKTPRIPGERKRSSRWSRARERETSERT